MVIRVGYEYMECSNAAGQRKHVHGWEKRRWRHLDLRQCQMIIEARGAAAAQSTHRSHRDGCSALGRGGSRWSKQFETWAIEVLLHTRSISDGSRLLCLGWDACDKMMECAVERSGAAHHCRAEARGH